MAEVDRPDALQSLISGLVIWEAPADGAKIMDHKLPAFSALVKQMVDEDHLDFPTELGDSQEELDKNNAKKWEAGWELSPITSYVPTTLK